jgi:hypothetical protein
MQNAIANAMAFFMGMKTGYHPFHAVFSGEIGQYPAFNHRHQIEPAKTTPSHRWT